MAAARVANPLAAEPARVSASHRRTYGFAPNPANRQLYLRRLTIDSHTSLSAKHRNHIAFTKSSLRATAGAVEVSMMTSRWARVGHVRFPGDDAPAESRTPWALRCIVPTPEALGAGAIPPTVNSYYTEGWRAEGNFKTTGAIRVRCDADRSLRESNRGFTSSYTNTGPANMIRFCSTLASLTLLRRVSALTPRLTTRRAGVKIEYLRTISLCVGSITIALPALDAATNKPQTD